MLSVLGPALLAVYVSAASLLARDEYIELPRPVDAGRLVDEESLELKPDERPEEEDELDEP
ncbi:hypothetical protein [uncultured Ralstonia sp.]|uniref:hypothetical protein n=1 Tax=uncultured Ralstonia sp. TaxID=114715 RepID=UPI0018DC6CBF|nr:hypothetical protein [uncultured Ralstonia sp.]